MECPKCGVANVSAGKCENCGIYVEKYARYLKRRSRIDKQLKRFERIKDRRYPFFFLHMLMFGGSGFFMAYSKSGPPTFFLFLHGGFAILVYIAAYIQFFGREEVKWFFINSGLGILGIYGQIGWILEGFGKNISDYPIQVHIIPFLYYILYTFLIRQFVLDIFNARDNPERKASVQTRYVVISILIYGSMLIL